MKKFISLAVTLLLLINSIYIPTAVFASTTDSEDEIVYTVPSEVLLEDDFEADDGDIGEPVPGFSHLIAWGSASSPNLDWRNKNYATFTYEYGVGGNNGKVGKFYDYGHHFSLVRYNEDGTEDTNTVLDTQRNTDTLGTVGLFTDIRRVVTRFKYYNAAGSTNSGEFFLIHLPKISDTYKGNISSTTPALRIYKDKAVVQSSVVAPSGNITTKGEITGLETKKWYDVEFEVIYKPDDKKVDFYCTMNGQKVSATISNVTTWNPNGYDAPAALSFGCYHGTGGLHYIDDLEIIKMAVPSESFEAAVEEFTFNEVVSGNTNNTKENVYDAWPTGLITNYQRGDDSYEVQWTSSNPSVISHDGKIVNQKSYAQKVTLTAKIIDSADVYATRTFKDVVVAAREGASVETILNEYAENNIVESVFSEEVTASSNRITKDLLPLPTRDDIANIDIEWSVSPSGYIDVATGEITRPSFSAQDVEVTLTASLSRDGSEPVTKNIKYTVAKNSNPELILDEVIEKLVITSEDITKITKDLNLPTELDDVSITWDTTGHSQIASDGTVTRGDAEVTGTIIANFAFDGSTRSKEYTLTVLPTVQKMLEIDINSVVIENKDALIMDFELPLVGDKYNSILSWESTSDYVQIGDNGKVTVKRPPSSSSDESANLIVTARIGRDEKTMSIPVTVLRQPSDEVAVAEAAAKINFDLIKGTNPNQDTVTTNLPLPTGFDYDNALEIEWSSNNESVVKPNGEVIRPLPGEDSVTVTLTAVVKKYYTSSSPVDVTFKVNALTSADELLQEAKDALIFSSLSSESIDNVTENLTLPNVGKYGTNITWISNLSNITVSGTEGIVTCPEWGQEDVSVVLKAVIEYNGVSTEKSFNITIPVSSTYVDSEEVLNENFNGWTDEFQFNTSTPTGSWTIPHAATDGTRAGIIDNIGGSTNPAIYVIREDSSAPGYLTYTSNNTIESTSVTVGMKLFFNEDYSGTTEVSVVTKGLGYNIATLYFNGADSTIDVVTANGSATQTTLKLEKGTFEKNTWNDLKFDINTKTKKFHLFLNGICISANGFVKIKESGDPFVTVNGIPYSYKDAAGVDGVKWLLDGAIGDTLYIDDLYGQTYAVHTEDQRRAAEIWEAEFLSNVNINHIDEEFYIPTLNVEGIKLSFKSGNGEILNTQGSKVVLWTSVNEPTIVPIYVTFDNGTTIYKKVYNCTVYPKKVVVETITDEQAVTADLKTVVDYIEGNYTLTKLKTDLSLGSIKVANGSTITYSSSDANVISNDGKITMADTLKTAKFTVTAQKGSATKSQVIDITVAAKAPMGGGPVGGGNGGGGGKPVVGENTNTQSGIDIGTPDDSENQGQTSQFSDLNKEHWAYNEINFLVEKQILNGVGDGKFEPERTINREEFVKMLCVSLGLTLKDAAADFTDVDKDEWYAPYVATIKDKGLILGYEDGSFGIGQNISRQDLAVLIYRSSRLAAEENVEAFTDDSEIADYAKDAVYTLRDLGIINGKGDGKFDPAASATRAETATMLYKAIKAGLFE